MPHWSERMDDELARRGVPARFRRRLLAELRDHADDLMDEEGLMMTDDALDSRLGEPAALATQAAEEYRRARWASRHPLLVFGLLPLPVTLLVFVATVLLFELSAYGIAWLIADDVDHLPRPAIVTIAYTFAWGVRFVPFILLAMLFTRLYLRCRVNRWWFVTAAAQVLLIAGSFISSIRYSEVPGQSQWILGFAWAPMPMSDGWTLPYLYSLGGMQVLQVVVPVTVGALTFRVSRKQAALLAGC